MLVLSRKVNEKILLPTLDITVQVVSVNKSSVRLGIEAPPKVPVLREELHLRQTEWQAPADTPAPSDAVAASRLDRLTQLLRNRLRVAGTGLAQLRRQLEAGSFEEIVNTLDKLEEDFELLRRRIDGEPRAASARPRALLVEDNDNERELLASFLRNQGVEVATAGDGTDALDYLSHHRGEPDVVLLDMGLPRCDGAAVVRSIRRDPAYSGLKIFAVSGHLPTEYDLAHGPAGVDRWFHKPLNPADLVADLARVVHVRREQPTLG